MRNEKDQFEQLQLLVALKRASVGDILRLTSTITHHGKIIEAGTLFRVIQSTETSGDIRVGYFDDDGYYRTITLDDSELMETEYYGERIV